jgi:hypothetical protein
MQEKFALICKDVTSIVYYLELTRSIILEIEALMDHKLVSSAEETAEINYKISQEIGKGLSVVVEMKQKLNQLI